MGFKEIRRLVAKWDKAVLGQVAEQVLFPCLLESQFVNVCLPVLRLTIQGWRSSFGVDVESPVGSIVNDGNDLNWDSRVANSGQAEVMRC